MEKTNNNVSTKKTEPKKARSGKKDFKDRKKRKHEMLRIVIRQLPPTITKEEFLNDISPLAEHTQFYMGYGCPEYKEFNYSRAYITFKKFEDVLSFKDRFDGYVFVNDKGHEYTAIVEFSPLQKMPDFDGLKVKKDPKVNTIESDPDYIEFLESLKQPIQKSLTTPDTILEEIQNRNEAYRTPQVTPLMEFILKRREEERRKKEEKRKKKAEEKKAKKKVEKFKDKAKDKPKKVTVNVVNNNNKKTDKKDPAKTTNSNAKPEKKEAKVQKKNKQNKEAKTELPRYKVLTKKPTETATTNSNQEPKPSTSGIKVLKPNLPRN